LFNESTESFTRLSDALIALMSERAGNEPEEFGGGEPVGSVIGGEKRGWKRYGDDR